MTLCTRTRRLGRAILMVLASGIAMPAAMAWTDKPVKVLVPAPAGGNIDVIARLVADQLTADLGQPMVVDNRPGAGGAIAVQALRAAPAWPHTRSKMPAAPCPMPTHMVTMP